MILLKVRVAIGPWIQAHLKKIQLERCPLVKVLNVLTLSYFSYIVADIDYLAPESELLTFSPDQSQKNIFITITEDNITESSESFTAIISEVPMSGVMVSITDPSVSIVIEDNDSKDYTNARTQTG